MKQILRVRQQKMPTFLNQVSQTGLMEKDGGQWRFRHQLLMEALCKNQDL